MLQRILPQDTGGGLTAGSLMEGCLMGGTAAAAVASLERYFCSSADRFAGVPCAGL